MDFGKKILQKYGYKEGNGLGKNSNGITEAIKVKFELNSIET
jgi:G-patch domain